MEGLPQFEGAIPERSRKHFNEWVEEVETGPPMPDEEIANINFAYWMGV